MGAEKETKYHTHIVPYMEEIAAWARKGVPQKEIAKNLDVADSTFRKYMEQYPQLGETVKHGKRAAVATVEGTAYKKATGFTVMVKKAFKVKEVKYRAGKRLWEKEHIELHEEEQYIPPTDQAIAYFLGNRAPEFWKSVKDVRVESADGKEIRIVMGKAKEAAE